MGRVRVLTYEVRFPEDSDQILLRTGRNALKTLRSGRVLARDDTLRALQRTLLQRVAGRGVVAYSPKAVQLFLLRRPFSWRSGRSGGPSTPSAASAGKGGAFVTLQRPSGTALA